MQTEFPFIQTQGQKDVRIGRNGLSINHGWFYIHFLVSVENGEGKKILNEYKDQFDVINNIQPNWYCSHLNEDEFSSISQYKSLEIFEHKKKIEKKTADQPEKFIIKAYKGWSPSSQVKSITHLGYGIYVVEGCPYSALDEDVDILGYYPYVEFTAQNRITSGFLQNGKSDLVSENNHYWLPRTLTSRGIDGTGQIVAVGDSGIDTNHSFFYDDMFSVPYNCTDMNHRKIVHYEPVIDKTDCNGHGTHVVGTILGKSWNDKSVASLYNGIAPEAKVWFIDIGSSGREIYEFDLESNISAAIKDGAGIFSASYGSSYYIPYETELYDLSAWMNKDFLYVMAAGNDYGIIGNRVGSAADGINIFTVGNVVNNPATKITSVNDTLYTLQSVPDKYTTIKLNPLSKTVKEPVDRNGDLIDVSYMKVSRDPQNNAICLVSSNEYPFSKIKNAQIYHCAFVVCDQYCNINPDDFDITIFTCSYSDFQSLSNLKTVSYIRKPKETYEIKPSISTSKGPTTTGLLKPDIAAPGEDIISAKSMLNMSKPTRDTSFNTLEKMTGTSMATPAISGCAALFRQYFMEGWYPSLYPSEQDKFTPSASLLKAAIINSASTGRDEFTGYGVPNLELGMGFQDNGVIFVNDEYITPKEEHVYEIQTYSEGNLSITLSFTAPPNNAESLKVLPTEMHLRVESYYTGEVHHPPFAETSLSTSSKLNFRAEPGKYFIHVTSTDYDPRLKMQYSLAIRGMLSTQKISRKLNTVYANCSSGFYNNGRCVCPNNATGSYCERKIIENQYSLYDLEYPTWFKLNTYNNTENYIFVSTQDLDANIRVCLTNEKDIDVNYKMNCYLFGVSNTIQNFTVGNETVYAIVYPSPANAYFSVNKDFETNNEESTINEILNYFSTVFICMIVFGALFVIVTITFIIYCIRHRKTPVIEEVQPKGIETHLVDL